MPDSLKQLGLRIITGQSRSPAASLIRGAMSAIEPFYSAAMKLRNAGYNRGIFSTRDLGRPTISIGNITTGGTGKTPVVKWLADEMRRRGHRPAILLRGYAAAASGRSDEAQLLDQSLNANQSVKVPVQANPSRVRGAAEVLREHRDVTHFILDDGFQHRRAKRDFNLVLISATDPFGHERVLPRGLLREPLAGLGRADAFLITRCSLATVERLSEVESFLCAGYPQTPILHCDHVQSAVFLPGTGQTVPIESLAKQRVFLSAGIGDPSAFERQIAELNCQIVGTKWFADHHGFTAAEVSSVLVSARSVHADLVLTTEKDWVKIGPLISAYDAGVPFAVARLEIRFHGNDAERFIAGALLRDPQSDAGEYTGGNLVDEQY